MSGPQGGGPGGGGGGAITNDGTFAEETGGNLAAILAKLSADPATQTTLAAVLAKLSADPATQTTLAAILALLPTSLAAHGGLKVEGVASGTTLPVTEASAASILTNITTLAGIVSAGKGLVTETSAAGIKTSVDALAAIISGGRLLVSDNRQTSTTSGSSLAVNGVAIKASQGDALWWEIIANGSGGTVWPQIHNLASGPPSNGAVPFVAPTSSITSGATSASSVGAGGVGVTCPTGILFVMSSTQNTYTAIASTAVEYRFSYT